MSFSGNPLAIGLGASGTQVLNLTGIQASAGGLTVSLSSSDRSRASVPSTVTFAAGGTTVTLPVTGVAPGDGRHYGQREHQRLLQSRHGDRHGDRRINGNSILLLYRYKPAPLPMMCDTQTSR